MHYSKTLGNGGLVWNRCSDYKEVIRHGLPFVERFRL